ncbi:MAG TPA: hypothetical protein VHG51_08260 [Longimicrobiaceae bacterium]|nr:hypothetical protein [Longimicrobiaceae bacterium]
MVIEAWIGMLGILGTMLLVGVGLLNFSVFTRQLHIAKEQIETAVRHLAIAQQQPDLHLIQRAITETSDHVRMFVERPYLRPYFYSDAEWRPDDTASLDEVRAMAELILNNFASALMHSAAFPQYPVRGIDRTIMFHMRHSAALREFLVENFDRFPFSGLTLLCLQHGSREEVEADLRRLIDAPGLDAPELERRRELLRVFRTTQARAAIEYTALNMEKRR